MPCSLCSSPPTCVCGTSDGPPRRCLLLSWQATLPVLPSVLQCCGSRCGWHLPTATFLKCFQRVSSGKCLVCFESDANVPPTRDHNALANSSGDTLVSWGSTLAHLFKDLALRASLHMRCVLTVSFEVFFEPTALITLQDSLCFFAGLDTSSVRVVIVVIVHLRPRLGTRWLAYLCCSKRYSHHQSGRVLSSFLCRNLLSSSSEPMPKDLVDDRSLHFRSANGILTRSVHWFTFLQEEIFGLPAYG